jgi:hypothetical protein
MMRVRLLLPLMIISLVLGGLLASCQPVAETASVAQADETCPTPIKETEPMNASEETAALKSYGIPLIDTMTPAHLETATFSLG